MLNQIFSCGQILPRFECKVVDLETNQEIFEVSLWKFKANKQFKF